MTKLISNWKKKNIEFVHLQKEITYSKKCKKQIWKIFFKVWTFEHKQGCILLFYLSLSFYLSKLGIHEYIFVHCLKVHKATTQHKATIKEWIGTYMYLCIWFIIMFNPITYSNAIVLVVRFWSQCHKCF